MKEKEFRKIVRYELKEQFSEAGKALTENKLSDAITNFYIWLMRKPIRVAVKELENNPKLKQIAQQIETQKSDVAKELLKNPKFLEFLLKKVKEKDTPGL